MPSLPLSCTVRRVVSTGPCSGVLGPTQLLAHKPGAGMLGLGHPSYRQCNTASSLKTQLPGSETARPVAPGSGCSPSPSHHKQQVHALTLLGQHPQPSLASTSEPTSCRGHLHWLSPGDGYSRARTNTWMATRNTPYCNLQIPQTPLEGAEVSRWPCLGQLESGRCWSPVRMRKHAGAGAEHVPLGQA